MVTLVNGNINTGPGLFDPAASGLQPGMSPDIGHVDDLMKQVAMSMIKEALTQLQGAMGGGTAASPFSGNMPTTGNMPPLGNPLTTGGTLSLGNMPTTGGTLSLESMPMTTETPPLTDPLTTGTSSSTASTPSTGNSDLENAMQQTADKDPTLYAKTMKDAKSGNGNELVKDVLQAYKEGAITKDQAIAEVSGAQRLANEHGGGKINKQVKAEAQEVLGGSYIKGGDTRAWHQFKKVAESFTPIGAIAKGIEDKTARKKPEDMLEAGQAVTQRKTQQAMQHMEEADPELAAKFREDAAKHDGNAMVEDMIQLKNAEKSGAVPNTFTDQDAQILGSQVGDYGAGKVNTHEEQAFTEAFGADTLYRGSTRGAKAFEKVEDMAGNMMQSLVAPVTDTVGGFNALAHGDVKGALKLFGEAAGAALTDLATIAAPELRIAAEGLSVAGRATQSVADATLSSIRTIGKVDDVNDGVNFVTGNQNGNNNVA
ncbi:hypothetical protein [Burkholderia sp. BCC1998]|uniref:hypothetical protein n=1 Tax=Burkholderia sp. BCC1998 TaxID=2817447 RepID=UPI002AB7D62C|nr:hypothetical protein [Burkholderia sp. BCC1998]